MNSIFTEVGVGDFFEINTDDEFILFDRFTVKEISFGIRNSTGISSVTIRIRVTSDDCDIDGSFVNIEGSDFARYVSEGRVTKLSRR